MAVTAEAVKTLRERTGAGMMECKKALVEANGDLDAAAEAMRKSGLIKADKKASRVAAEGVIVSERSADGKLAAIVEVNCETDFVARETDFGKFAAEVAKLYPRDEAIQTRFGELLLEISGDHPDVRSRALGQWRRLAASTPPHSPAWYQAKLNVARLLVADGQSGDARTMLRYLKAVPPGWSQSPLAPEFEALLAELGDGK